MDPFRGPEWPRLAKIDQNIFFSLLSNSLRKQVFISIKLIECGDHCIAGTRQATRGYSPSNWYRESNRLDVAWQVLHWELRACHFYQAQKHSIFWMEVRFLNAVCILIEIWEKKLDSMRFFLCKGNTSEGGEKNCKSLVNDVGSDDGGSSNSCSSSSRHVGNNFGITGCLFTLYMPPATIPTHSVLKLIFFKS